jgi:hypothetical protein
VLLSRFAVILFLETIYRLFAYTSFRIGHVVVLTRILTQTAKRGEGGYVEPGIALSAKYSIPKYNMRKVATGFNYYGPAGV